MRRTALGLALAVAAIMLAAPPARAQTETQKRAIGALTTFALAYTAWTWEARCNRLSATDHAAFKRQIEAQLLRLNAIFDARMVGAATSSGRDTANSPRLAACDGDNADFGKFGMDQARDVDKALGGLPEGFRLVVTP